MEVLEKLFPGAYHSCEKSTPGGVGGVGRRGGAETGDQRQSDPQC